MKHVPLAVLSIAAIAGCGRSHVSIEAPGVSIHSTSDGLFVNNHPTDGSIVNASGNMKTETRTVTEFHGIQAESGINVKYIKAPNRLVNITAADNVLERVKATVEDGVLHLELTGNITGNTQIVVAIANPHVDRIELSGAVKGEFENLDEPALEVSLEGAATLGITGNVGALDLDISGAAKLKATLTGDTQLKGKAGGGSVADLSGRFMGADLELTGASNATVEGLQAADVSFTADSGSRLSASGTAQSLTVNESGAASLDLASLVAQSCKIQADGGSQAKLNVKQSLTGNLSGGSQVQYAGNPATVSPTLDSGAQVTPG
jgi:hypothetical protein